MIISSRRSFHEDMAVRRTPTKASFGPTPLTNLSDSTLRVPYIDSPQPSPGLPSILPRHGKKPTPRLSRRLLRILWWAAGVSTICWIVLSITRSKQAPVPIDYVMQDTTPFDLVESDSLPEIPSPILVTDQTGRAKWTVSMPSDYEYPLSPSEYSRICSQSVELAYNLTEDINQKAGIENSGHHDYYHVDPNFIDIDDAEHNGILPSSPHSHSHTGKLSYVVGDELYGGPGKDAPECAKTMTFVMQTEDAGLGATLMGLWMSYGLAKKEGRSFFIDDTDWAYGPYTNYFQLPPMPSCRPPFASHRIPYPRHARHLLVSSATASWTFGHQFTDHFENPRKMGVDRQREIFGFVRTGYDALFRLSDNDETYYQFRAKELKSSIPKGGGLVVGVHVRHGDRHPQEFQYQKSYIPLDRYTNAANNIISSSFARKHSGKHTLSQFETASSIIVASDNPDVYTSSEMLGTNRAQSLFTLISKSTLDTPILENENDVENHSRDYEIEIPTSDANLGWEGGFYSSMFWSLGANTHIPSAEGSPAASGGKSSVFPPHRIVRETEFDHFRFHPPPEALYIRELVGRAYLLDLAVLSKSDAVVCAVSSVTCRLLGVMMGWEKAIAHEGWRNVDGNWHWKGIIW